MRNALMVAAATAAALAGAASMAQDATRDRAQDMTQSRATDQIRDRDIYGYGLMTPQERDEYRARMRATKTAQEREQIRAEHHERMLERAKERGVTLPNAPPSDGGSFDGKWRVPAGPERAVTRT